jgi:hypothetical protein
MEATIQETIDTEVSASIGKEGVPTGKPDYPECQTRTFGFPEENISS